MPLQTNPGSPDYASAEYQQFLARGISVVVTDYAGQGTPGDPAYLVGRSAGRNVLDALRAAERIEGSGLSPDSPVGISGYSQGGQAAVGLVCVRPGQRVRAGAVIESASRSLRSGRPEMMGKPA